MLQAIEMSKGSKYTILYVDDEEVNLRIFKNTFRREYNIITALSAREGILLLEKEAVDLIISDQRMPEMTGVEFLVYTTVKYPEVNRLLITAYTDFDALRNAINEAKIYQYIQKPWTENSLRAVIENAIEVSELKRENQELNSHLKEKNEMLEKVNKQLLSLDQLKTEFLSIINHQIRTPLNGLSVPLELLRDHLDLDKNPEVDALFNVLEQSVKRLEQYALSALRITSLKAKTYKLELNDINLNDLVHKATRLLKNEIDEHGHLLEYDIIEPVLKNADDELVLICIKELISNSIKYSPAKSVISIRTTLQNSQICIEVADNGNGFPEKVLNNQSSLFVIGDKPVDTNIGLDLALIKLIMEAHEGSIVFSNNENKGACVKLFFKS